MLATAGLGIVVCGELQAAHPAQVDPVPTAPLHHAHKDLLTVGAADDDARRLDVNVDPSHRVDVASDISIVILRWRQIARS